MKKLVLFGAGEYGKNALDVIDGNNVAFFLDNNPEKEGDEICGIPIHYIGNIHVEDLRKYHIIISVYRVYAAEIEKQLEALGIDDYEKLPDLLREIGRKRISERQENIAVYKSAISWIKNNSIKEQTGRSIIVSSGKKIGYPEVTGYYIPSLIRWGYRELAEEYADWLVSIQREDGAITDPEGREGYVFDTAQVLKGWLAARAVFGDKYDESIRKGCEWIISNMQENGRLTTPDMTAWKNDESLELIHIYGLSPLIEASEVFENDEWKKAAERIWRYYKDNNLEDILDFKRLIHFHAYLMEALLDIGEKDLVSNGMERLENYLNEMEYVPAYSDVHWKCSTGLFQLAIVWYRLGDIERGNKVFESAIALQNESGGWYGSYATDKSVELKEDHDYFEVSEISWANKFFLDALYYKNKAEFNVFAPEFKKGVFPDSTDGRFKEIDMQIKKLGGDVKCGEINILDAGCGNGRYLARLSKNYPQVRFFGSDISDAALSMLPEKVDRFEGTLTYLPIDDNVFDMVYVCEAFEHSVDFESAIRELSRVIKPDGILLIVDKNADALGEMEIGAWEQWPDKTQLAELMMDYCKSVERHDNVSYDGIAADTFCAWIGVIK